ncbi:MAG: histidine utilization repressor [Proteobacteria bacterium]|nr:histidine utilization repressor [Pseudomonadota bacterium]
MPSTLLPPRPRPQKAAAPYALIKQHLKEELGRGRWPPGAPMPSDAELVAQFGVSRMTVTRALNELRAEGLIERVQGVGTFAAHLARVASQLQIRDLHEEISARGHRHRAQVQFAREESAGGALAARLGVENGARVFHTLIVHLENDVALQCEDRYVNAAAAPQYLDNDFTRVTPTQYLLQVAPLWQAQYSIEAARPTAQEARLLGIVRDEPCLVVVRRTVGPELPITLARLVHPGSRYLLQGEFKP